MSERCPRCGCDKQLDVSEVLHGRDWGVLYYCGTIYWPSRDEVTREGVACRQLVRAQERINWLEGQWIAIRDMVSCDGDMVDDLIPYVEAVMEDYHAYHTQKRRLEREISQKQAQEQRDVALSSAQANPYAAVVEAAIAARDAFRLYDNPEKWHKAIAKLAMVVEDLDPKLVVALDWEEGRE